jgi:hypothetical protein
MSADLRLLPPVGYHPQTNKPIWTRLPPGQREKWMKRWALMDSQGKEARHYSKYEWELRRSIGELEVREQQLHDCIRSKAG